MKPKIVYGEVGLSRQISTRRESPGDAWRKMKGLKPEKRYWICEEVDAINGVWVEVTPPIVWDNGLAFMEEFTPDELTAIFTLAQTQIDTNIWITTMAAASSFTNQDQRTLDGMAYLLYQGLITQARYDIIMGTQDE